MKIEIGESLAQSWLKHVEGCQVVQLNWKASGAEPLEEVLALAVFQEATGQTGDPDAAFFPPVGKPGRDPKRALKQFLGQAEVDAFGVKLIPATTESGLSAELYAVDVAFHSQGLGGKYTARVAMKMIRSALALLTGFHARGGRIIFASPKVLTRDQATLETIFSEIARLFERHGLDYRFELITNKEFERTMLVPTIQKTRGQTDMAELFLRSVRMLERFPEALNAFSVSATQRAAQPATPVDALATLTIAEIWNQVRHKPANDGELGIGAALQLIMQKLDADSTGLARLRSAIDAGHRLGMGNELTPFRSFATPSEMASRRLDALGRPRYYATPLANHQLLFSSEWNYQSHYVEWTRLLHEPGLR